MTQVKTKTKKAVAKKSGTKSKKSDKRVLVCANGEQCFWATDGRIIANLVELRDALAQMEKEVFKHHVNSDRNDFANWINDVLQDPELAQELRSAKQPSTAHTIIVRRLKSYEI